MGRILSRWTLDGSNSESYRSGPMKTFLAARKSRRALEALVVTTLWCSAASVMAHHSFGAEYDANKPITLTGVVTSIEWTNPHSYLHIDVSDEKGNVASWKLEGYPPNALYRTGWKKDVTIKPGDKVTIFGWRARDGTNWAHSREVTFADGKKLFFGPPAGTGDGGSVPAVKVP
jgi:Family of unknown function (DUF6152)